MNCEKYKEQIDLYIDNQLDNDNKIILKQHLKTCKNCQKQYEDIKNLKLLLDGIELKPLPDDFEKSLHRELVTVSKSDKNNKLNISKWFRNFFKLKMPVSLAIIMLVAILGLNPIVSMMNNMEKKTESAICGTDSYKEDFDYEAEDFDEELIAEAKVIMNVPLSRENTKEISKGEKILGDSNVNSTPEIKNESEINFKGRLIIKSANMELLVNNFDEIVSQISTQVLEMGGYIEESSSYYYIRDSYDKSKNKKRGYLNIRIPYQYYDSFISDSNKFGEILNFSSSADDITKMYRDKSDEVKNLEVRENKLREIMQRAEDISDVIEIEKELSRVRYEINSHKNTLKDWEDLVSLSTINIQITERENSNIEVKDIDKTLIQKAKEGLIHNTNRIINLLEGLLISLISYSIIIIPIILVLIFIIIKFKKRWKK